jgi:hypothetical protein
MDTRTSAAHETGLPFLIDRPSPAADRTFGTTISVCYSQLTFRGECMRAISRRRQIGRNFHLCSLCNPPRLPQPLANPLARNWTGSRKANILHKPFSLLSESSIENELTVRGGARSGAWLKTMSFLALFVVGVILGLGFNVYALLACSVIAASIAAVLSFSNGLLGTAITVISALASLQAGYVIGLLVPTGIGKSSPIFGQGANFLARIVVALQMLLAGRRGSRSP